VPLPALEPNQRSSGDSAIRGGTTTAKPVPLVAAAAAARWPGAELASGEASRASRAPTVPPCSGTVSCWLAPGGSKTSRSPSDGACCCACCARCARCACCPPAGGEAGTSSRTAQGSRLCSASGGQKLMHACPVAPSGGSSCASTAPSCCCCSCGAPPGGCSPAAVALAAAAGELCSTISTGSAWQLPGSCERMC
jgi:hypothetical protein